MRYEIYIAIEGKGFDAAAFDRDLPPALRGELVERRRMRRPDGPERIYWRTKLSASNRYPEEELLQLLEQYRPILAQVARGPALKISPQIVGYQRADGPYGFYIPAALIRVLADIGADLDIDVVRDLSEPNEPVDQP